VNNANIAVQNASSSPLDATNNWWGMPKGASDQNRAGGDLIGVNIFSQPHLTIIPPNCDLSVANWIPFNEQELQFAINANLPYLNGLDFALVDVQKGIGAKFTLVAKPIYGGATGEAYITITPSPDGSFMRIMLDILQLPSDENLSKIATCELMPLFMNSLQQVQNKFTQPSQLIEQMVVMDSSLMMLFSPPTEITPDPAPEIVMNYDSSCLLSLATSTPSPTPSPTPTQDESEMLIQIPPMEGEIGLMENNITQQLQANMCTGLIDEPIWCQVLQNTDVFTYVKNNKLVSINRLEDIIYEFIHPIPNHMTNVMAPSWGVLSNGQYLLAFGCDNIPTSGLTCFWDSATDTYRYSPYGSYNNAQDISPNGLKMARQSLNLVQIIDITDLNTPSFSSIDNRLSPNWSDSQTLYTVLTTLPYQFTTSDNEVISDDENLLYPYFYDVRNRKILYWRNAGSSNYQLVYRDINGGISLLPDIFSSPFPVIWSPHANELSFAFMQSQLGGTVCISFSFPTSQVALPCEQARVFADWETGIDLRPYFVSCLSPDPYAPPADTINLCIQELAEYGIIAFATGLPTQQPALDSSWTLDITPQSSQYYSRSWTVGEIQQVLRGAQTVASTFYALENSISEIDVDIHGTSDEAKNIFRAVMGEPSLGYRFYVLRVTSNGFTYNTTTRDGCYGTSGAGCVENNHGSLALYSNFYNPEEPDYEYIQRIVVHEFGHRFDNQTGTEPVEGVTRFKRALLYPLGEGNKNPLYDCGGNAVRNQRSDALDDDGIIFGVRGNGFARGLRGWGTPAAVPCSPGDSCQQTYFQINPTDDPTYIRGETAADMFLNWVYRRIKDGPVNWTSCALDNTQVDDEPQEIGDWQGFRNIDAVGVFDTTLPGNARYEWMENFMITVFDERYGSVWSFNP